MQEKTLEEEYSDYLSSLPLQTLRTLGRRLGISAESRKSKPGCIQALIDLLTGKALPVPVSGKGAPVKHNYLDPSILRHLEDLRLERNKRNTTPPNTFTVCAPDPPKNLYEEPVYTGILEIMSGGYGFLRAKNCQPSANGAGDVFIAAPLIHSLKLREGDRVACTAKPSLKNESAAFQELLSVNGIPFGESEPRPQFETLTACYPEKRIPLSEKKGEFSLRVIDLFTPIGKGQRALVIAPPKAGKTTLLKEIAVSCARMRPDVHLIVLLIDERPEEVTEFKRCVSDAEVIYSTFDEDAVHHTRAARLTIEHAKRYAEHGRDVVVLLDSLTRLTRAYNQVTESSGKTLTGGLDAAAFAEPKRFFGAARNTAEAGSITIIASVLVETGSRMDDVIYEEFKGTGNCDIVLSRELSERRIFPAIDLNRSGTRKEELLLPREELEATRLLREKHFTDNQTQLFDLLKKTKDNAEFAEKCKTALPYAKWTKETK